MHLNPLRLIGEIQGTSKEGGLSIESVKLLAQSWKEDQIKFRGLAYTDEAMDWMKRMGVLEFIQHPKARNTTWGSWTKYTLAKFGTNGYLGTNFLKERGFGPQLYPPPPEDCMFHVFVTSECSIILFLFCCIVCFFVVVAPSPSAAKEATQPPLLDWGSIKIPARGNRRSNGFIDALDSDNVTDDLDEGVFDEINPISRRPIRKHTTSNSSKKKGNKSSKKKSKRKGEKTEKKSKRKGQKTEKKSKRKGQKTKRKSTETTKTPQIKRHKSRGRPRGSSKGKRKSRSKSKTKQAARTEDNSNSVANATTEEASQTNDGIPPKLDDAMDIDDAIKHINKQIDAANDVLETELGQVWQCENCSVKWMDMNLVKCPQCDIFR